MTIELGEIPEDFEIIKRFSTRDSTGLPITFAGSPALAVYKDEETATEKTTAEAYFDLDVDFDGKAGYHNMRLDLSGDAFFAVDSQYSVVVSAGTVDGVSVVGETLFTFNVTTAKSNQTKQYDTTGLTGDTFPATQSAVANLAVSGSAANRPALDSPNGFVITLGENEANNEDATKPLDGITHDLEAALSGTEDIDCYYVFNIGGGVPVTVTWHGYLDRGGGSAKNILVQAHDVDADTWRTIETIQSGTSIETHVFNLFIGEVGSGANLGIVHIRFLTGSVAFTATTKLLTDQIFVSFNQAAEGYENAAIWYDDAASNTNTVHEVDGVPSNPVSTEAAVETLLVQEGLHRVEVAPGSLYTLASTHDNRILIGDGATLALGGQSADNFHAFGMAVSGVTTAATNSEFHDCAISTMSGQNATWHGCSFTTTVTMTLAGDYSIINGQSGVAGVGGPTFTKTAGQTITVEFRRWSGSVTASGIESGDVFTISGTLGDVVLNGADGTVVIDGTYRTITDNRTGAPVLTITGAIKGDDVAAILVDTDATIPALIADILTAQLTESYAANGVVPTLTEAVMAIHQMLMDFSISGTTITVEQLDGSTAFLVTLDDATVPTSAKRL